MTLRSSEFPESSVRRASHDDAAQTLTVEFRTGRSYLYKGVPGSVYDWLVRAKSKGAYINGLIKDRYEFEEVTPHAAPTDLTQGLLSSLDALRRPRDD